MTSVQPSDTFYLGRYFDPQQQTVSRHPVYYNPGALSAHTAILGMKGTGKTGLGLVLMEEAIQDNIPVLVIDSRGQASNLLLAFPELDASSFLPWIPPTEIQQSGKDAQTYAAEVATYWRNGLAAAGITPERVRAFQQSSTFQIYTPGSAAGLPVKILDLLRPPCERGIQQQELRERIRAITDTLLTLSGYTGSNAQDKNHAQQLIARIMENACIRGMELRLNDLVIQIQSPSFEQSANITLSENERRELARQIGDLMIAPENAIWNQGDSLDINNLLYTPDNRSKVSIFYLPHLNDTNREAIIALILEKLLAWLHTRPQTDHLRAVLYIDEIFGYVPPEPENPATKALFLQLLKEATSYGLGIVLSAASPERLDFRALSGVTTWFIGRLQSDNDRKTVYQGLQHRKAALNLQEMDKTINALPPWVFMVYNAQYKQSLFMQTRFPMSYICGALSLEQVNILMKDIQQSAGISYAPPVIPERPPEVLPTLPQALSQLPSLSPSPQPAQMTQTVQLQIQQQTQSVMQSAGYYQTPPEISSAITQYYLPINLTLAQTQVIWEQHNQREARITGKPVTMYQPFWLSQIQVRYLLPDDGGEYTRFHSFHVYDVPAAGVVEWKRWRSPAINPESIQGSPVPSAIYAPPTPVMMDEKRLSTLEKELLNYVHQIARLTVPSLPKLKVFAFPDESFERFQGRALDIARQQRAAELAQLTETYNAKLESLRKDYTSTLHQLESYEEAEKESGGDMLISAGEAGYFLYRGQIIRSILGLLRITQKSGRGKDDVDDTLSERTQLARKIDDIQREFENKVMALNDRWTKITGDYKQKTITADRDNMYTELIGLAWKPFYYVRLNDAYVALPAWQINW